MEKKRNLVLLLVGLASAVSAQSTVTLGTFGYTRNVHTNTYHISGMQFLNSPSNTPGSVYGASLPVGSKIYVWNGVAYDVAEYNSFFIPPPEGPKNELKWDVDLDLGSGEGYWVETAAATNAILSGNVPMEDAVTNSISIGYQMLSYPYPVDRVVTNLDLTPSLGDKIYAWNGTGYDIIEYNTYFIPPPEGPANETRWSDESYVIAAGRGFWYEAGVAGSWVAKRPYPEN